MIGDKSKHSIREIQKIGTVKNRPIEVLPYEKELNNNLAVVFKANNYNDREIIVEQEGLIDNRPIGYIPNNVDITNENIILDFGESAYNVINLTKNIKIQNIINYVNNGEYYIVLKQDEVGGHITEIDFDIPLYLSNNKGVTDISTSPNTTTLIKIHTIFDKLYGSLEIIDGTEYVFNQMTSFEFNIRLTSPDLSFTLPIAEGDANYIHNFTVDWGDTNTNQIDSFDSPDITHTYSTAGDYKIKITGVCEYFAFNNLGDKLKMLSLIGFKGDCGFRILNFYGCTNLTGVIPTSFTYLSNLETAERLLSGCQNLTGSIPENMFWNSKKINNFKAVFLTCKNLTGSIPEKLFWYNPDVIDFTQVFANCINLTGSIPEKIFWYNPKVKSVYYAFGSNSTNGNMKLSGQIPENLLWNLPELEDAGILFFKCTNLTGSIPEKLFYNNTKIINLSWFFAECGGLTGSIPEKLLWNLPNLKILDSIFTKCIGLSGIIPEKLFFYNKELNSTTQVFYKCTNLTGSIPEKLFYNNTKITNLSWFFGECGGLTGSIPEKLFWNLPNLKILDSTFYKCFGLSGALPEKLLWYNIELTTLKNNFYSISTITGNIPDKFIYYNVNLITVSELFDRCSGLNGELPSYFFINNKNIRNFTNAFRGLTNLTGRGWDNIISNAEQNATDGGFVLTKVGCFNGCTTLEDYTLIPAAWR